MTTTNFENDNIVVKVHRLGQTVEGLHVRVEVTRKDALPEEDWVSAFDELVRQEDDPTERTALDVTLFDAQFQPHEWKTRRAYGGSESLTVDYTFPDVGNLPHITLSWKALGVDRIDTSV